MPTFEVLTVTSSQDQLIDMMTSFQALNREVRDKESSIDTLIEKGADLITQGTS